MNDNEIKENQAEEEKDQLLLETRISEQMVLEHPTYQELLEKLNQILYK